MVNTLPRSQWTNEHHYWVWKQQQDLMARLNGVSQTAAALFLDEYGPHGMVLNFDGDASIAINDAADLLDFESSGQVSNGLLVGPGAKLTNTAPSAKLTEQADGNLGFQAHNLLRQSENFTSGTWGKTSATSPTANTLQASAGSSAHLASQVYASALNGASFSASLEMKMGTHRYASLQFSDGVAHGVGRLVDLQTGTILGPVAIGSLITVIGTPTIEPVGDGWYKLTIAFAHNSTSSNLSFAPFIRPDGTNFGWASAWTATGAETIQIRKAHLRRTPSASDYIATTTTAAYDLPYVYSSGVRTGIMVEPAATNVTFPSIPSAAEAAAAYSGSTIFGVSTYPTIAAGSLVAPISGAPTIRLTWNGVVARYGTPTSATSKHVADSGARSVVTSVYARAVSGTVSNVSLVQRQTTGGPIGSVTPTLTETWQRIAKVSTTVGGNGGCGWYLESSGTGVIEIVQYDHCVDTVATSPIITYGSTVLRAADTPNALLNLFPAIGTAYTIYAKYKPQSASVATTAIRLDDTTANELVSLGNNASGQGLATVTDGGAAQAAITSGTITASAFHRVAASVEGNNVRFVVNGGAEVQDTSVTLPTLTRLLLTAGGGMELAQLAILPGARTEAQLQALGA